MPPATTISESPVAIPWAASITAFKPEPQTLLMVKAATLGGRPAPRAAWRAGACPRPAETTLPMMTSSTASGVKPARATASFTTIEPSWGAVKPFNAPRNLPVGNRTAERITASRIVVSFTSTSPAAAGQVAGGGGQEELAQLGVGDAVRRGDQLRSEEGGVVAPGACGRLRLRGGRRHLALAEPEARRPEVAGHAAEPGHDLRLHAVKRLSPAGVGDPDAEGPALEGQHL